MDLEVSTLKWLTDSGYLEELQKQCEQHHSDAEQSAVYKFVIHVDPSNLLQYNAQLGNLLLHTPQEAWKLLQQVCYTIVSSLDWLPTLYSPSQLLLVLRLTSLPDLPGYAINHVSELPPLTTEPRFYVFRGVVCGMSTMEKYTQHACFSCPNESCPSHDETFIRLHVPGASEAATVRGGGECYQCGSQLAEKITFRTLADKLHIRLVPNEALCMCALPWQSRRYQSVGVVIRDELCGSVKMGGCYTIIGLPTYKLADDDLKTLINITIETNNILPAHPAPSSHALPTSIAELYKACQYSPWAFTATLAYSFAAEVTPPGSYHRLKLAMLLSLVACLSGSQKQQHSSNSQMLDILAIGSDTELLLQLLLYGGSLAPRSLLHTTGDGDLFGSLRKLGSTTYIDGGSLVLAEEGVCLVGNISSLKTDTRGRLEKVLETKRVTVNVPQKTSKSDRPKQMSWPLRCSVWACADQQQRKRSFAKADNEIVKNHSLHETLSITKVLADHMAMVMVVDPNDMDSEEHLQDMLTQHLLQRACGETHPPLLSHDDFKHFMKLASSDVAVELGPRAKDLLMSFYVASRRVRVSSVHSSDIPHSALDHMSAIALAHARLSLRNEATEADAVMAILLYEESLASRFGYSVLNIQPCPHFKHDDISMYIGKQFDADMRVLYKQIIQFCKCHDYKSTSIGWPEE